MLPHHLFTIVSTPRFTYQPISFVGEVENSKKTRPDLAMARRTVSFDSEDLRGSSGKIGKGLEAWKDSLVLRHFLGASLALKEKEEILTLPRISFILKRTLERKGKSIIRVDVGEAYEELGSESLGDHRIVIKSPSNINMTGLIPKHLAKLGFNGGVIVGIMPRLCMNCIKVSMDIDVQIQDLPN
ncbi:hypothetical protein VNO77_23028 [Canavalia gladiata]|uniref:Uncharacterized protein n=1 Tax=Canavalia gladiata TaxID=3824 RepID=A0AAN9QBI1_CANGL